MLQKIGPSNLFEFSVVYSPMEAHRSISLGLKTLKNDEEYFLIRFSNFEIQSEILFRRLIMMFLSLWRFQIMFLIFSDCKLEFKKSDSIIRKRVQLNIIPTGTPIGSHINTIRPCHHCHWYNYYCWYATTNMYLNIKRTSRRYETELILYYKGQNWNLDNLDGYWTHSNAYVLHILCP